MSTAMSSAQLPHPQQELDAVSILSRVRQLVDAAPTGRAPSRQEARTLPTVAALRKTARGMLITARSSVTCVVATPGFAAMLASVLPPDGPVPAERVSVLVVAGRDLARQAARLCPRPGQQLRIAESLTNDLLLVDDRQVLGGPSTSGGRAMVGECPLSIDLAHAVFRRHWESGIPHAEYERMTEVAERPVNEQVLALLALGLKDDAAAARLGVSVRTFRRHVADMLRELGIRSRFQLGMHAHLNELPRQRRQETR